MGLFIGKHIVAAHRGSLDVTSEEGDGTVFTARIQEARSQADKIVTEALVAPLRTDTYGCL
ncbi:hypothetical protein ACW9YV_15385 (plasmid) [Paraburkholderia strydomiana]